MKISAIAGRGAKRDFVDVYAASARYGLAHPFELFAKKFARVNYSAAHVVKSLVFFEDAEKDPMPDMLVPISWAGVEDFLLREAPQLLNMAP